MPICDDPNATGFYWLRCDKQKPLATRPMFICRFITRAKRREVNRILEQAYTAPTDGACYLLLMQAISAGVVGWKNFGDVPFSTDALADRLTDSEIWELARGWVSAVILTEDDLKNSELPATGEQASSATSAEKPVAA